MIACALDAACPPYRFVGDGPEPADATVAFFQACDQYAALAGAAAWLSSAGTPLEREMVDGAELLDGS